MIERIDNEMSGAGAVTIFFVGIDEFSRLCAASSYFQGIQLLGVVKERLKKYFPEAKEIIEIPRKGFLFILDEYKLTEPSREFAQKFIDAAKEPFEVDGDTITISLSVGIASKAGKAESSVLLDQAQYAYHLASNNDGSSIEVYDPKHVKEMRDEFSLKNDLYQALDQDEFFLKYQPVISLEDNSICGAEALVRWEHPDRGLISPGEFIPLAEKTGQILFLDRWVLENALKQIETWNAKFDHDLPIGVNISAWQFRDKYLVEKLNKLIQETSCNPELLKIEITETSMMSNVDRTSTLLENLKDLGVRVALDDFGTGHATFEYLAQFPIDELKIDRSFLKFDDVYNKNQKLLEIMIQTGKRIGIDILAEGVEEESQLNFVKNHGCHKTQGFLFSKPIRPKEFEKLHEENDAVIDP